MTSWPARSTLWRWTLAVTALLAGISLWEAFQLAQKLGVAALSSKSWLVLLGGLALTGLVCLGLLGLSFFAAIPVRERLFNWLEIGEKAPAQLRWAGILLLLAALAAYPLVTFLPYLGELLGGQPGMRLFIFWMLSLTGMQALRLGRPASDPPGKGWLAALLVTVLFQASLQRVLLYLPDISTYPFAMGWSETSRFYYPSLFLSKMIFGQSLAWPILHPSLHFVLVPPYLIGAPLWFHRFWQVALRFILAGLISPALIQRLHIPARAALSQAAWRWLTGLWIFLTLFTLPLYLHLAVPVFIMLWGFSSRDDRRTWFWLVLASIWAGLSRLNWYPVPGMLAAALYFLEVPPVRKNWTYLIKPALWFAAGTFIAFISMQIYIALSGITDPGDFFTSLGSAKLWERLWPNASYPLGVLPGSLIFSIPFWLAIYQSWKAKDGLGLEGFGIDRLMLLVELLVLFAGGLVVSMKIGGGADIHNMDAYAVLLLVITACLIFGTRRADLKPHPVIHWAVIALLVLVPGWFSVQGVANFWRYDPAATRATLASLQGEVDQVNASGGEILFITQRHLISMHMLTNVKLVPEYEREELMEMAMAKNDVYLQAFRADLERHRFAAIVVDPLRFNFVGDQDAMGAENNAWTRYVAKRILCSYQQESIFPADRIAIYVPQAGAQKCP